MSDYANRNFLIRQKDGRKQESPDGETCGRMGVNRNRRMRKHAVVHYGGLKSCDSMKQRRRGDCARREHNVPLGQGLD